jgi:hypothetical protein
MPTWRPAGVDPLAHYLIFGIYEGRSAFAAAIVDNDGSGRRHGGRCRERQPGRRDRGVGRLAVAFAVLHLSGDTSGGGFAIDPITGVITVLDTTRIDFESNLAHSYTLTVTAHDGEQTSTQTFTIKAVDAAPEATASPQVVLSTSLRRMARPSASRSRSRIRTVRPQPTR